MKIYVAGYTRDNVLRTFDNLPREHKPILAELQMEKLSEGTRDGFLWKIHSNKMFSCTLVSSLWDKKIDERRIPMIVSYVMDKDAAEFIMESPLRLLVITEQLKRMEREDVIHFSNAEVMDTWDDSVKEDIDWDIVVDRSKVEGIVKAVVKLEMEKDAEFAGFVYESKAEIFAALDMLPMAFRMNVSFSFPFAGCGAAVCDINMTDQETMKQSREKSYNGWPIIQKIVIPRELETVEKTNRVFEEIQRLYHTYGKIPFKDRDAEVLASRLEMLSHLNEYNGQPTKTLKKIILKNKSKKMKIDELLKFIEGEKSEELMDLVRKGHSERKGYSERKGCSQRLGENYVNGNNKNSTSRNIKCELLLLVIMALLSTMTIFVFQTEVDMRTIKLFITFATDTVMKYVVVFLFGLFTGISIMHIGGSRREKR